MWNQDRKIAYRLALAVTIALSLSHCAATPQSLVSEFSVDLASINWIHGAEDCDGLATEGNYTEWQQVQYQPGSFIFRQNKCSNYEAPFVYFFLGKDSGLLIDSGATAAGGQRLLELLREITDLPILLAHTHGHGDHRLGDKAFRNQAGIAVVEIGSNAVQKHFGFTRWPDESTAIDLGGRVRDFAYPRA